jgi:amino acid adenylation domain-containing protein
LTVIELLNELAQSGLRVREDRGQLLMVGQTGSVREELRLALAVHKEEVLSLLRRQTHPAPRDLVLTADPANRFEPFPLTDIQQAYWVGGTDALGLGNVGCHYYQEFDSSNLDLDRFEHALRRLIRRHDMLRAVVGPDGRQRTLPEVPDYRIHTTNLRGQSVNAAEGALNILREELSHQFFPPSQWPLFEVRAALLDGGRVRIYLSFDLLMIDAASMSRLIRDWERLYVDPDGLAPLELSFRDCVLRDIADRQSDAYRKSLDYWDSRLDGLPPPPDLPARSGAGDLNRMPARRERRRVRIEAEPWDRLKTRAASLGITPSALLAAAFSDIIAAWSRACPFLLNLTLCRRTAQHPEIELLLGDFTTTVLLAVDPRPATFRERAERVHEQICADLDRAAVSGVEVARRLRHRKPDLAQTVAPVVFTSLLGQPGAEMLFSSNWIGHLVYGVSQTPQVALDHQAFEEGGDLVFHWDFVSEAFADGVVAAMLGSYRKLLASLATDDSAWTDPAIDLLPREQRSRRTEVNDTHTPLPGPLLQAGFEACARLAAERTAVVCAGGTFTYGELDRRSLELAARLIKLGATPGHLVAVVMQKGWEQVVAVLGILRAGAAYLPIDARLPSARIRQLLLRCEVSIAVTQSHVEDAISWPPEVRRLAVDRAAAAEMPRLTEPLDSPGSLAYVIFTSGSTGEPKGVMIDHRGAVNTILDINRRFRITAADKVLALSSLEFDLSVYDIFGVLAAGGAVVIPEAESGRDPQRWAEWVRREGITVWNSVPALMKMLTEYAAGAGLQFPSLRLVMLSGDWIPVSLPARIREVAPKAEIVSLGGATEASIWSIFHSIGEVDTSAHSILYGKALANQTMHVLNGRLDDAPDFVRGDIYIGGVGLAKGYWRNLAETDARFIVHPSSGERLYRTGDLGRFLPDGNIELLGREDFQVKIQGHRIELGEIESVLRRRPEVRDVVVVARGDRLAERQLHAYIVVSDGAVDRSAEWREFLQQELPSYMVPASFIAVDALPLTANGKVDRSALPQALDAPAQPPKPADGTAAERAVAEIVRSVLGQGGFGLHEPLFSFGCTSLHVVQIHRRLSETFQRNFSIADIFNRPTVALIAELLAQEDTPCPAGPRAKAAYAGARSELASRRSRARRSRP